MIHALLSAVWSRVCLPDMRKYAAIDHRQRESKKIQNIKRDNANTKAFCAMPFWSKSIPHGVTVSGPCPTECSTAPGQPAQTWYAAGGMDNQTGPGLVKLPSFTGIPGLPIDFSALYFKGLRDFVYEIPPVCCIKYP